MTTRKSQDASGAKAHGFPAFFGTTKVVPCYKADLCNEFQTLQRERRDDSSASFHFEFVRRLAGAHQHQRALRKRRIYQQGHARQRQSAIDVMHQQEG